MCVAISASVSTLQPVLCLQTQDQRYRKKKKRCMMSRKHRASERIYLMNMTTFGSKFNNNAASGNNKHLITFYISACPIIYYLDDLSSIFAWLLRPFLVVLGKQPVIKGPGSCFHGNCVYVPVCVRVFNKMIEIVSIVQKSILQWLAE